MAGVVGLLSDLQRRHHGQGAERGDPDEAAVA
jgi:hypothetical protein